MRVIFAGTPEPAVIALQRLLDSEHEVIAVLTRPDAKKGRGRSLHPSPVAELAAKHGIEVLKPESLKADTVAGQDFRSRLADLEPDCIPVVAYGNLVTPDLLDVPDFGWVNLHFSLLPQWRGAAPVQAAINAGDDITGASTFQIEEGLDTGPVFGTVTEEIKATDTAAELLDRLSHSGAELLVATMDGLERGDLFPRAQKGEPSYAPKISKENARINWNVPAIAVDRHIRAHNPAPGAWTMAGPQRFKIGLATPTGDSLLAPGVLRVKDDAVLVGTSTTDVQLKLIQPPGKKMMDASAWARGAHIGEELVFDDESK